jgi:hypothetical protein
MNLKLRRLLIQLAELFKHGVLDLDFKFRIPNLSELRQFIFLILLFSKYAEFIKPVNFAFCFTIAVTSCQL